MPSKKTDAFDFEQALAKLSQLVEKMEHGNLPLEQALQHFEQGVGLVKECQHALQAAERRVQILSEAGQGALTNFQADNNDPPTS